jgi:hypothetical protein
MTPYDDLIARISDLIRDGDRTVKARAEDIVGLFTTDAFLDRLSRVQFRHFDAWDDVDKALCIEALRSDMEGAIKAEAERIVMTEPPMETPFLTKYKP